MVESNLVSVSLGGQRMNLENVAVVVTGGDSEWLAGHLPDNVIVRPNLVFLGIHRFFSGL